MPKRNIETDPTVSRLEDIRRLLMAQLVASGVSSSSIADLLGVDISVVSRVVPARKIKKELGKEDRE